MTIEKGSSLSLHLRAQDSSGLPLRLSGIEDNLYSPNEAGRLCGDDGYIIR
jgi:hypothetical protein